MNIKKNTDNPLFEKQKAIDLHSRPECTNTCEEKIQESDQSIIQIEKLYSTLMLSLKEYVHQNSFKSVIIGLSGGIDSAIVATIAADAFGTENVFCYMLPTKYTSQLSIDCTDEFVKNLGVNYEMIDIELARLAILSTLNMQMQSMPEDKTEENIQSRIRGLILMALSNKFSRMLLSTGNKSESYVGYATIYGDMCGGFAPIKNVYKTDVYKLCNWRNKNIPKNSLCKKLSIIPESIIKRPPTAELKYNQTDQDTLPPYEVLDNILSMMIDNKIQIDDVAKETNCDINLVKKIFAMFKKSEFKRKQSPYGALDY